MSETGATMTAGEDCRFCVKKPGMDSQPGIVIPPAKDISWLFRIAISPVILISMMRSLWTCGGWLRRASRSVTTSTTPMATISGSMLALPQVNPSLTCISMSFRDTRVMWKIRRVGYEALSPIRSFILLYPIRPAAIPVPIDMDADPGYLFMVPIHGPHRHSDRSPQSTQADRV